MNEEVAAPKRRRWPRILAAVVILMLVLVLGLYFYLCSRAFFSHWIQPRIEAQLGRDIQLEGYAFSPWGRLRLEQLTLSTRAGEEQPPLELRRLEARYSLGAALGGTVRLSQLEVEGLSLRLRRDAQGRLHGPLPQAQPAPAQPRESQPAPPAQGELLPVALDLANIRLSDIDLRYEAHDAQGRLTEQLDLSGLSLELPRLELGRDLALHGGDARLQGSADLRLLRKNLDAPADGQPRTDERLKGRVQVNLTLSGGGEAGALEAEIALEEGEGILGGQSLRELRLALAPRLDWEAGQQLRLETLPLTLSQAGQQWAALDARGQLNLQDHSGRFEFVVEGIDHRTLDMLAPPAEGLRFRDTKISALASLELAPGARPRRSSIELLVDSLNPTGKRLPQGGMPATDISLALDAALPGAPGDPLALETFQWTIERKQAGRIVSGTLTEPLTFDPQTGAPQVEGLGPRVLELKIDGLDLPLWTALFAKEDQLSLDSGSLDAQLSLGAAEGGQRLRVEGTVGLSDFQGRSAGTPFGPVSVRTEMLAQADPGGRIEIDHIDKTFTSQGQPLGQSGFSGWFDSAAGAGEFDVSVSTLQLDRLFLPPAVTQAPIAPRGGQLDGSARVVLAEQLQSIEAEGHWTLQQGRLVATASERSLDRLGAKLDFRTSLRQGPQGLQSLELPELALALHSGERPLLDLDGKGSLAPADGQGKIQIDLRQADLRPFLELQGALPPQIRLLESGAAGQLSLEMAAAGRSSVQAALRVEPFAVSLDPDSEPLRLPLTLDLDAGYDSASGALALSGLKLALLEGQGSLSASGNIRPGDATQLDIRAEDFPLLPLIPLVPQAADYADLSRARLGAEQEIAIDADGAGRFQGRLDLDGLRPADRPDDAPLALRLDNTLRLGADQTLTLDALRLAFTPEGGQTDTLDITGQLALGGPAPAGSLQARCERLLLTPLLPYASLQPAPQATPLTLGALSLDSELGPAAGRIALPQGALTIAGGQVQLQGIEILSQDGADPAIAWQQVQADGLQLPPLLENLAPAAAGRITGTAALESNGRFQGTSEAALRRHARGEATLALRDGVLQNLEILNVIATTTNFPELRQLAFATFDARLVAGEERADIERLDIVGPLQKISLGQAGSDEAEEQGDLLGAALDIGFGAVSQGTGLGTDEAFVGYDRSLSLPIRLAVAGPLRERLEQRRSVADFPADEDGYLWFPVPLAVGGSIDQPRARLNLTGGGAKETLKGLLEREILGDREEEEKEATPTPAPPATPVEGDTATETSPDSGFRFGDSDEETQQAQPTPTPAEEKDSRREAIETIGRGLLDSLGGD